MILVNVYALLIEHIAPLYWWSRYLRVPEHLFRMKRGPLGIWCEEMLFSIWQLCYYIRVSLRVSQNISSMDCVTEHLSNVKMSHDTFVPHESSSLGICSVWRCITDLFHLEVSHWASVLLGWHSLLLDTTWTYPNILTVNTRFPYFPLRCKHQQP